MINKFKSLFLTLWCVAALGVAVSAQTVGEGTIPVSSATLSQINLPAGARLIKESMNPPEVREILAKLVAQGGSIVQQGKSEVLLWGGDYRQATGERMIKSFEQKLRQAGWEYEIGAKEQGITIFTLLRETPQRRALVGFFSPTNEAFLFAVTEMVRADISTSEQLNQIVEVLPSEEDLNEQPKSSNNSGGASSSKIVGAWFRSDGTGGATDGTGKTKYNSGTDTTFEFFADGKMQITIKKETLSITQCRINETTKLSGTYSISGNQLTMNLSGGSIVGTNSCQSSGNFKKSLTASTLTKTFVVKNLESVFRPDAPLILCLDDSSDDKCFERLLK